MGNHKPTIMGCVALVLVIVMSMTLFACGGNEPEPAGLTDQPEATAQAAQPESLKVALVLAGGLGDRSFYDSANEGLEMLKSQYGVEGKVLECKEDDSQIKEQMLAAAQWADVIVPVGWQMGDALASTAPEFPDKKFIYVDEGVDGVDNILNIKYKQNEGSFLVGYIAGKMSASGKVGAVGGADSDVINDFLTGYREGVLYANPNATVEVRYTEDYEDPAKGKEAALALYDMGSDIVFAVAGKTGEGVFAAGKEQGKFAIGVDSDQKYIDPDVIICSMMKKVGQSLYDAIGGMIDGSKPYQGNQTIYVGFGEDCIGVGYGDANMTQQVSEELKAEVEELKGKIISGEIVVGTTR